MNQDRFRSSGEHRSDQGAIWEEIRDKAQRRKAESPSMAMSEIYEKEKSSIEEYTRCFKLTDSQVGALFMINSKVVGMDASFNRAGKGYKNFVQ